ncbi:unnamed protein product [Clavelina lepadiformis]|uniref:Tyrosine-protein phosphatase domain-containing protein n=1 Tax=Clavelina lepadiformis TaxID=159417 RepID=A0ABP0GW25_CLALP
MANNGSKNPVKILRGGFEDFSAMYPFLRTQKIIYTPQELDLVETFPCELLPGILYIGSSEQAQSYHIHKELKIQAHINVSKENDTIYTRDDTKAYLQIPIDDTDDNNEFSSYIEPIVNFIDVNRSNLNAILVWSKNGVSRSAAACLVYLMVYYKWTLKVGIFIICPHYKYGRK